MSEIDKIKEEIGWAAQKFTNMPAWLLLISIVFGNVSYHRYHSYQQVCV